MFMTLISHGMRNECQTISFPWRQGTWLQTEEDALRDFLCPFIEFERITGVKVVSISIWKRQM